MSGQPSIRIIAGTARGAKIRLPSGIAGLRPTQDRVREALFNILGPAIGDARFLDLYAGSGANGIEALSRGARESVFVESNRRAVRALKENLDRLKLAGGATVLAGALPEALKRCDGPFNFVLADPPYADFDYEDLIRAVLGSGLLATHGILVIEHDSTVIEQVRTKNAKPYRLERYGTTTLSFFDRAESGSS